MPPGGMEEGRRAFTDPWGKARRYQLEVLRKAVEENTIVFLDTGCGKTLIAVLLISKLSMLYRRPSRNVAVFLVPSRALVEQQAMEIEEHTNLYVGRYCGDMVASHSWNHEWWQDQVLKYEVMVMTPQILLNNLHHCFLKMEMIELLVFDESHHAQDMHPYAKIMRDFYHGKEHRLPKIFGLTASPVKRKVAGAALTKKMDIYIDRLERMLDAEVYVLKEREEVEKLLPNPNQQVREYEPSNPSVLVGLLRRIINKHAIPSEGDLMGLTVDPKEMEEVFKIYRQLDHCAYELGLWCTIEAAELHLGKQEQSLTGAKEAFLREVLSELRGADPTGQTINCGSGGGCRLHIEETLLSPKLLTLIDILENYKEKYTKCIVFVDRIVTTTALVNLFNRLESLSFIECLPLVGSQSMTQKTQQTAIDQFRSGKVNLLVATDVAEEGLDIQSCSMVVRFDGAPKTSKSYIQSRGRARMRASHYLILLERGNQRHWEDVQRLKEEEEELMSRLTGRANLCTDAEDGPSSLGQGEEEEQYEVPSTGATVTTDYSVVLLHRYCSKLAEAHSQPTFSYVEEPRGGGVACEIGLPALAPLQTVLGRVCRCPKWAKKVAALKVCKELHQLGALTDHLLPAAEYSYADEWRLQQQGDDAMAELMAQKELHSTLVPEVLVGNWTSSPASITLTAYGISVVAKPSDREYADFGLFLGRQLDERVQTAVTELSLDKGRLLELSLVPHGDTYFDTDQLRDARRFQEKVLALSLHRELSSASAASRSWDDDLQYLTLPVIPSLCGEPVEVDWRSVRLFIQEMNPFPVSVSQAGSEDYRNMGDDCNGDVCGRDNKKRTEWKGESCWVDGCERGECERGECERDVCKPGDCNLDNGSKRSKHERGDCGRRSCFGHFVWKEDNGLERHGGYREGGASAAEHFHLVDGRYPVDRVVGSLVEAVHNRKLYHVEGVYQLNGFSPFVPDLEKYESYVHYYKKGHKLSLKRPRQLLLKVKPLKKAHNLLVRKPKKETGRASKKEMFMELPPELCKLRAFGFPSRLMNTVILLPSFMHRLECFSLAAQLQTDLQTSYPEAAAVSARTVLQALTTAKTGEALHYERFELLGDSFLKFAVSKFLFLSYPQKSEGALTILRTSIISNVALHRFGVAKQLPRYINDDLFSPLKWSAPGGPSHCDPTVVAALCGTLDGPDGPDGADSSSPSPKNRRQRHRWLQKKVVADVVEALIGAHLVDGGHAAALAFLNWVGIPCRLPSDLDFRDAGLAATATAGKESTTGTGSTAGTELTAGTGSTAGAGTRSGGSAVQECFPWHSATDLSHLSAASGCAAGTHIGRAHSDADVPATASAAGVDLGQLEKILNYTFRDKLVLVEALTHPSYSARSGSSYQRLEYLGDAVLDYLITTHLYDKFPRLPPGDLTILRSATVSNNSLALKAVRAGLDPFLLADQVVRRKKVKFVEFVRAIYAGTHPFYGWEVEKYPKVLGDIVESIAGAVLVDTGFDQHKVWGVFEPLMSPIVTLDSLQLNPVSELTQLCKIKRFEYSRRSLAAVDTSQRRVAWAVTVGGGKTLETHSDKKSAERLAALAMLQELKDVGFQHPYRTLITSLTSNGGLGLGHQSLAMHRPPADQEGEAEPSSSFSDDEQVNWHGPSEVREGESEPSIKCNDYKRVKLHRSSVDREGESKPSCNVSDNEQVNWQRPYADRERESEPSNNFNEDEQEDAQADVTAIAKENSTGNAQMVWESRPDIVNSPQSVAAIPEEADSEELQKMIDALLCLNSPMMGARSDEQARPCPPSYEPCPLSSGRMMGTRSNDILAGLLFNSNASEYSEDLEGKAGVQNVVKKRSYGRVDLHELCDKYRWDVPTYEPCPDFSQGPQHALRFVYTVKLNCSLQWEGQIKEYDIECEGEVMKTTRLAMDSAASFAMSWLQDRSMEGMTFAKNLGRNTRNI